MISSPSFLEALKQNWLLISSITDVDEAHRVMPLAAPRLHARSSLLNSSVSIFFSVDVHSAAGEMTILSLSVFEAIIPETRGAPLSSQAEL